MNKNLLKKYVRVTISESKKSDAFEEKVASIIDSSSTTVSAIAMKPVQLPDVHVTIGELSSKLVNRPLEPLSGCRQNGKRCEF